jgi:hypothetical protein
MWKANIDKKLYDKGDFHFVDSRFPPALWSVFSRSMENRWLFLKVH